jgi:hypothetical protein
MSLPSRLTIREVALCMDVGTILLMTTDEAGHEHTVKLVQRASPQPRPPGEVPGRLYFDDQLVTIRSDVEAGVLSLLRSADVTDGGRLSDQVGWLTARDIVRFVSSEEYLCFADRVEQETDDTRYAVWVAWDDATFGKAVVRTKQLLNLGLKEARDLTRLRKPVATGVRAPEVVDLARRFRAADLSVRVEPAFRWRLP